MGKEKRPRWRGPEVVKPMCRWKVRYEDYIRPISQQNDQHVIDYRKENESGN